MRAVKTLGALALALLLAGGAAGQFAREVVVRPAPGVIAEPVSLFVDLRLDTAGGGSLFLETPYLVAGLDNPLNLTVHNQQDIWFNATFEFNVTGATPSTDAETVSVPPRSLKSILFTVHPDDVGRVIVQASSPDGVSPFGDPVGTRLELWAVPPVSLRFLDPQPRAGLDPEYEVGGGWGGLAAQYMGFARVRPGQAIVPVAEVTNPLDTGVPGFDLVLRTFDRSDVPGGEIARVEVEPLGPRETRVIEFPEFVAQREQQGGWYGGGPSFQLWLAQEMKVGGLDVKVGAFAFRVENGALREVVPASALVEVRSNIVIDVLVPKNPTLGVPKRIKFNVTNFDTVPVSGVATIRLETPQRLHYGVQGPEVRNVDVRLNPGQQVDGYIEFTPRVTGYWSVSSHFRTGGMGYGGESYSFQVPGPVAISVGDGQVVYARIGEPVRAEVSISTAETLQGAELRIASTGGRFYGFDNQEVTGDFRNGIAQGLVSATNGAVSLGTLRPGGALNASLEVVASGSGRYTVIPFVLAEGFAYTSQESGFHGPGRVYDSFMPIPGPGMGASRLELAVQPRSLPTALALMPLTVGLAVFVGTWTMRTRFVK